MILQRETKESQLRMTSMLKEVIQRAGAPLLAGGQVVLGFGQPGLVRGVPAHDGRFYVIL